MNKKYTKKIFGTVIIAIFILSLTMAGFSYAQAQSNGNNKAYKFSGVVKNLTCPGNGLLTVDTSNNGTIVFKITDKTTFTRGLDCSDISTYDNVHTIAKKMEDESYTAKVVQKDNNAGYGRDW